MRNYAIDFSLIALSSFYILPSFGFVTKTCTPLQKVPSSAVAAIAQEGNDELDQSSPSFSKKTTRAAFLQGLLVTTVSAEIAVAFDGGVGGLGKTKPITGVEFFEESSIPIQNAQGIVTAEIKSVSGKNPILVEFQTPWPLLPTTSGLEARDIRSTESAFVQVLPATDSWKDRKVFRDLLINSVLASQGKYGAYGTPTDIKVKPTKDSDLFVVTFTSYTPAMRESERQLWIQPKQVDDTLVLLIVGTTRARFASQEASFSKIVNSFLAVAAPESRLRAR